MIDMAFGIVNVKFGRLEESQKEFVDDLQMRPGQFQDRFVFFGVKGVAHRVHLRRDRAEQIDGKLDHT